MNKYYYFHSGYTLILLGLIFNSCIGQVKNDLPFDNEYPKLIKTIGNPRYGNVQYSLQDKAGNLWFGTTENGLYKYDASQPAGQTKSFSQFLVTNGLYSNNVYSLLEDKDGNIWIGTDAGLCIYNPSTSPIKGGKTFIKIQLPLPKNLPPDKDPYYSPHWVYSIMQAKNGKIWVVTRGNIYIYDGQSKPIGLTGFTLFKFDQSSNDSLSGYNKVERILEDNAGNIWFGGRTNEGVYRYDGKSVTNLKLEELFQDGPKPKAHNWGWPQLQDKKGNIWFSNWGGAYLYDGKSFKTLTKKDGLPGGVTRIIEDKRGNIWFGGDAGAGLSRYDGNSFNSFTTSDGLLNNSIWSILEDENGNIWVGTRETGLYLYNVSMSHGQGKNFITISEHKQ